jgi:translation initiation factor IF-2
MVVSKRMADANDQERTEQEQKRPLSLRTGGTLGLRPRPAESGSVRQSFSHGRSKQVTVEVRKKRVVAPGTAPVETPRSDTAAPTVARAAPATPEPAAPGTVEPARRAAGVPRTLTAEEHATRVRVLQDAEEQRRRQALVDADRQREEAEQAAEEALRRAEDEARRRVEEEEARRRETEEAKKRSESEEARRKEEDSRREVAERAGKAAAAKVAALAAAGKVAVPAEEERKRRCTPGGPALYLPSVPPRRSGATSNVAAAS